MIKTIAHLCILSHDLQRTLDFYCGVLGLRKKFDFIRKGELFGFYLEVSPGNFIEFFKTENPTADSLVNKRMSHFCLEVESIDVVREKLVSAGIEVTQKIMGADDSWQIWCKDPDEVEIEFHEYTPKSRQFTGEKCEVDW